MFFLYDRCQLHILMSSARLFSAMNEGNIFMSTNNLCLMKGPLKLKACLVRLHIRLG